jgi:hypothetical protein
MHLFGIGSVVKVGDDQELVCVKITKKNVLLHDKVKGKHVKVSHKKIEEAICEAT